MEGLFTVIRSGYGSCSSSKAKKIGKSVIFTQRSMYSGCMTNTGVRVGIGGMLLAMKFTCSTSNLDCLSMGDGRNNPKMVVNSPMFSSSMQLGTGYSCKVGSLGQEGSFQAQMFGGLVRMGSTVNYRNVLSKYRIEYADRCLSACKNKLHVRGYKSGDYINAVGQQSVTPANMC